MTRAGARLVFVVSLAPFLLSGCIAADKVGVRFDGLDRPVVIDCGTWIEAVTVTDADTGRVVWAAHATSANHQGLSTRGRVEVGTLPASSWTEAAPLVVDPRPAIWRFRVKSLGTVVVDVRAASMRTGRVYRANGHDESQDHFDGPTCTGIPLSTNEWRLGAGAVTLAAVSSITIARRRRKAHR